MDSRKLKDGVRLALTKISYYFKLLTIAVLCSFCLSGIWGCADYVAEKLLGGKNVEPLGNGKYQVTYDGVGASKHWTEACVNLCGDFSVINSNQVNRPNGISGWTGIIQCTDEINDPKHKVFSSGSHTINLKAGKTTSYWIIIAGQRTKYGFNSSSDLLTQTFDDGQVIKLWEANNIPSKRKAMFKLTAGEDQIITLTVK